MEVPSMDQEFVEDVAHCDNGAAIGREKLLKYFNLYDKVKQTSDKEKAVSEVCIFTMMHSKYNLHAVLNLPHSKSSDKTDIVNPILDNQIVKTFNKKDFLEYTLPDGNINNRYFILKY
jgi:F0F1-type ATP synthase delta subunit